MKSRGLWRVMGARTKRSLALSWSALFVLSLLLQYFTFAFASPALAVHDEGLFELDGNTANDPAVTGDDWDSHPGATGNRFLFITDPLSQQTDDIFTGGSTKDDLNTTGWQWTVGSVPDKDNIENAFAASYDKNGHTFVYFGLDRFANNGDAFTGFWFFKGGVGPAAGGTFSGPHQVGDLLVLSNFTNGGATSSIQLLEWVGSGGNVNGTLQLLGSSTQECTTAPALDLACAVTNEAPLNPSWNFDDKFTNGTNNPIPVESFFEGGIDLDQLFGGNAPCFGSFLAETRASQQVDAVLKDFAGGSFNTCVPPTITTDASVSTFHFGNAAVTDTATLAGTDGPASGTVKFFVCGPTASEQDCTSGGTQVGGSVGVTTSANGGTATSAGFTPDAPGTYCFRAEYTPDQASQYLAAKHTNDSTECFTAVKNVTSIVTSANQSVSVGQAIADSATLSGATSNAGGTIVFKAYGPGDNSCADTAAFTSDPFTVSGNGLYGPASFTPSAVGTYHWIATYSGDTWNAGSAGACGDTGENDTVNKVTPSIATQASADVIVGATIHDTATVSGGLNPTGTVTFNLYGPNDATCANPAIFTSGPIALSSGSATSGDFTTLQVGTYRWRATYNGDSNNNAVTGACNAANENVVVNKTNPSISTLLSGGGHTGATISIDLGTAVHDTSTLAGATATAGGTVHYQVFSDSSCTTKFADGGTKSVVDGAAGDSDPVTFNQSGNYYWQADYSGDANNNAASSNCSLEVVAVALNPTTITTNASESVAVGGDIHDTATLAGGFNPTGTITFRLFGPDDATCTSQIAISTADVNGNGDYSSASFTTSAAGTYRWIANYSGDANNAASSGACNDANEFVVVTKLNPTVVTVASASVDAGGKIHDTATLAGGFQPTGSMTFNLYGPDDANCSGAVAFTSTVLVDGNGQYVSGDFTTVHSGTYRWIANYGGDANNNATANGCNGENENVIVTKVPVLTIEKSVVDATADRGTDPDLGVPAAKIGDTLTYTLHYSGEGLLQNAFITDVLPVGLVFVNGSALGNADFNDGTYDAVTRTITWLAKGDLPDPTDGSLTYHVTVPAAAADQPQPLINTATIDSDQTAPVSDTASVAVLPPPEALTPPPTDTFTPQSGTSNPGFALMLILLGVAGLSLAIGFMTPAPARVRRRDRLG
jgi:uncharacterized repeat protein (TIGR01451 family)